MVEVYTYWRGDLVDVRRVPFEMARRLRDGVVTHVINDRPQARERLLADVPDWAFWRILVMLGIAYLVVMIGLAITPNPKVKYVLWEPLGTLTLSPALLGDGDGDGLGRLYVARPHLPSDGAAPSKGPRKPLIPSPPGSRTYQAPEPAPVEVGVLGLLRTTGRIDSVFADMDSIEAPAALLSGRLTDEIAYGGSVSVLSAGGDKERYGVTGGVRGGVVGGVIGRGGGGAADIGTFSARGTVLPKKVDDDVIYRKTTCREIVGLVRAAADELEEPLEDPPTRTALLEACRSSWDREAMVCITKLSDQDADREELLEECGADLPQIFLDALGAGLHRPAAE